MCAPSIPRLAKSPWPMSPVKSQACFVPSPGPTPDPHWQAREHEPGSGPPPGWTKYGREVNTAAILGDKLVASFTDHRRLLDEYKPDAVLVTMEPRKMPPVLIDCLEAGVHVFHEKPACGRIEDYRRVVEVANRSAAHLCVAFNMRGLAAVREARSVVQSGALGRLFGMQVHYVAEHPRTWLWEELADGWMYDRDRGGGHLIFLGCHYLDLMRYITDANVRQVAGFADNVGGEPINAEDAYAVSLRFDNGMVGTFSGGFMTPSSQKHDGLQIWGSRGWLRFNPEADDGFEWFTREGTGVTAPERRLSFTDTGVTGGFDQFKHEFFQACLGNGEPPVSSRRRPLDARDRLGREAGFRYRPDADGEPGRRVALCIERSLVWAAGVSHPGLFVLDANSASR